MRRNSVFVELRQGEEKSCVISIKLIVQGERWVLREVVYIMIKSK